MDGPICFKPVEPLDGVRKRQSEFSQFLRQSRGGVGPQGVLEQENVQDVAYPAKSRVEESEDLALDHVRIGHGQEHRAGDRANHRRIKTGDTRDLNRDLDPASGLGNAVKRHLDNSHCRRFRPRTGGRPYVAIVTKLPFDLRQQSAAKNINDFRLLPLKIAFPVVVDIGRRPGTGVEQTIAKAADQTKLMTNRMGGDDRGGERLDAFNNCQNSCFPCSLNIT